MLVALCINGLQNQIYTSHRTACPVPAQTTMKVMAKRIMIAVVGAGIGALAGLLVDYLGAGTPALVAGAAAGALIPQFVLGPPGR